MFVDLLLTFVDLSGCDPSRWCSCLNVPIFDRIIEFNSKPVGLELKLDFPLGLLHHQGLVRLGQFWIHYGYVLFVKLTLELQSGIEWVLYALIFYV